MLIARDGRLRLEAESPLGGALATLATDGADFQLLDLRDNQFLVGAARPCNLARLLQVALAPTEVAAILLGAAPLEGTPAEVSWDGRSGGREVLTLRSAGGEEKLWLDARERVWDPLVVERRDAAGRVAWRVRHEGFVDHAGVRLPTRTATEEPGKKREVQVRYRGQEPNVETPDALFRLAAPAGLPVTPVGCE
jgi:hypothetical protein